MKNNKNIIVFFERVIEDDRLYPSHISMYVSLFQFWSLNRFQNSFRISREDVMKLSKIRSIATYHKCIRELCRAGFIRYSPSYNSYKGSLIEIVDFDIEKVSEKIISQNQKFLLQDEIRFLVPVFNEVELYFSERDLPSAEADRFFSYYRSKNWKLSNEKPMKCWQAAARNWISELKKYIN